MVDSTPEYAKRVNMMKHLQSLSPMDFVETMGYFEDGHHACILPKYAMGVVRRRWSKKHSSEEELERLYMCSSWYDIGLILEELNEDVDMREVFQQAEEDIWAIAQIVQANFDWNTFEHSRKPGEVAQPQHIQKRAELVHSMCDAIDVFLVFFLVLCIIAYNYDMLVGYVNVVTLHL